MAKNNIVVGCSNYDNSDDLIDPMLIAFNWLKTVFLSDIESVEMNSTTWLDILKWIIKQIEAPMYFFEGLDITEDAAYFCIGT